MNIEENLIDFLEDIISKYYVIPHNAGEPIIFAGDDLILARASLAILSCFPEAEKAVFANSVVNFLETSEYFSSIADEEIKTLIKTMKQGEN